MSVVYRRPQYGYLGRLDTRFRLVFEHFPDIFGRRFMAVSGPRRRRAAAPHYVRVERLADPPDKNISGFFRQIVDTIDLHGSAPSQPPAPHKRSPCPTVPTVGIATSGIKADSSVRQIESPIGTARRPSRAPSRSSPIVPPNSWGLWGSYAHTHIYSSKVQTMDANQELEMYRQESAAATKSAAIATSLSDRQLNPGAAAQLTQLWGDQIQLIAGADGRRVAIGPNGQSVRDFVESQLQKPEYHKFVSGNRGSSTPATAAAPSSSDGPPRTLQEAINMQIASTQQAPGGNDCAGEPLPMLPHFLPKE